MKSVVTRMVIAMGLLGFSALGTGCDTEPEGSCTINIIGSHDVGGPQIDSYEECRSDSTASVCAQAGGTFQEGGDCILFDLLHPPT